MNRVMKMLSLKIFNQPTIFLFCVFACLNTENSYSENNVVVNYDSLLRSNLAIDRLYASQELEKGILPDTLSVMNEIAAALKEETENPLSRIIATGTYVPETEMLKYSYGNAIIKLSNGKPDYIKGLLLNATGEYRDQLFIMLSYFQDSSAHYEIPLIYKNSPDPYIRLSAITALKGYKDTLDVPLFIVALYDSLVAYDFLDDNGKPINSWHPINNVATAALKYMGYNVIMKNGKYEVIKRK